MNYNELCKAIASLYDNIEVVIVLSNKKIVASNLKQGGPMPSDEEFRDMISQIETIIRTTKINEDKFGSLDFIVIHYKYIDGLFFPLNDKDTLIIGIVQPYNYDVVMNKILELVKQIAIS